MPDYVAVLAALLIYPGTTVMDLPRPHYMFCSQLGAKFHLASKRSTR